MTVYVIKDGDQMKLMKVQESDRARFLFEYAGRILCQGDSIQEAIIKYSTLPYEETRQDSQE